MTEPSAIHQGHRQRLKDRFLKEGLDHFNEVNALELMLFYCVPRRDTNPLAHRLLDHFGSFHHVLDASREELLQVEGVTENTATYLTMFHATVRYYEKSCNNDVKVIANVDDCAKFLRPYFRGLNDETVYLLCLDAKCKVLCCKKVGEGSVNSAHLSIRKIVETAMNANAVTVVLAHNHPSGLALPSPEDVQTTKRLRRALETVEIILADHIIVSDEDYTSLCQSGLYSPYDRD